jgi:pimeloyl-ACP methyl ester carboxylesterase
VSEATAALPNGLHLAYETFGDPGDEPLLLVMGLGGPMNWWHTDLCRALAARGFHVIRYDNRDIGRSSRVRGSGPLTRRRLARAYMGDRRAAPYQLADMADDAFGLMDALEIGTAHVTGVSMGGMIAQTMALTRPDRVRSLVSIMSTTGSRRVGWADPRLLRLLLAPPARTRDEYITRAPAAWAVIGSPGYPHDDAEVRDRAAETWDRGADRSGATRQMLAVVTQSDRTAALGRLRMPTCVIHGLKDRLVHPSGGRATARAVPGAELVLVPAMGHDLPRPLWPLLIDAITRTAARAGAPASDARR